MMSLGTRLTLSATVVLVVFLVLTGLALERAFRDSARAGVQERLLGQSYLLMAAAEVSAQGRLGMPAGPAEARFGLPDSGLYGQILDGAGRVVWQSPSLLGTQVPHSAVLGPGEQQFIQVQADGGDAYFVFGYGVDWVIGEGRYSFTFNVTEDPADYHAQLQRYRTSLWGWLGVMAVLLLLMQLAVLRWGLRPTREVAEELTAIEAGRQDSLQGSYPRELRQLTANLNALLRHERARQSRYRDALADLAHSIKTPLAVLRGTQQPGQGEESLARAVEEQVARMDRIVNYQLQRAATAGSVGLSSPIAIRPVVARVVESLDKVHRDKAVTVELDIDDEVTVRADEGDLTELLGNLLDNAYKWCRSVIRVRAGQDAERLVIEVEDDGKGIAPDRAEALLGRGVRADETVPGHGIGLAIVRDIVRAYEGEITISDGDMGGARVSISLPRD